MVRRHGTAFSIDSVSISSDGPTDFFRLSARFLVITSWWSLIISSIFSDLNGKWYSKFLFDDWWVERVVMRQFFPKAWAGCFFCCLFMYRNGTKKLKKIGRRFLGGKLVWKIGPVLMGKRRKNMQNWSNGQKSLFEVQFWFGHPKCHVWYPQNG